MTARGEGL
jgi:hypothetical protein